MAEGVLVRGSEPTPWYRLVPKRLYWETRTAVVFFRQGDLVAWRTGEAIPHDTGAVLALRDFQEGVVAFFGRHSAVREGTTLRVRHPEHGEVVWPFTEWPEQVAVELLPGTSAPFDSGRGDD